MPMLHSKQLLLKIMFFVSLLSLKSFLPVQQVSLENKSTYRRDNGTRKSTDYRR